MSNSFSYMTRRKFITIVPVGIAGSILFLSESNARIWGIGFIFRISSFGVGSVLGLGIAAGLLVAGAVAAVQSGIHAIFSEDDYGGNSYSANTPDGWKKFVPSKPIIISETFDPEKKVGGDILRLRAHEHNILINDGIMLPNNGRLIIEEDGTMIFADTRFNGYAEMQQDGTLSVFTEEKKLVLLRKPRQDDFCNLHHNSYDGNAALSSLLGEIQHA